MKPLTNLSTIANRYDAFLLDLWGVIHDGTHLYPGVKETLIKLREADKKIIMISNAPRRSAKAIHVLDELGVEREWYDHLITSGEMGYRALRGDEGIWGCGDVKEKANLHISTSSHPFYYYIGPSKDEDILDGLDYRRVYDVKEADFLLNVGFGSEEQANDDWTSLWQEARALDLPMLCLNPDFEVVKINGARFACAGVLALDYEKLGGKVTYYGKPFPEVYEHCMGWLNNPLPNPPPFGERGLVTSPSPAQKQSLGGRAGEGVEAIKKSRILAIGDGIATDIKGAVNFGVDSVLVTGGILKNQSESLEDIYRRYEAVPDYVIPAFVW